MLHHYILMMFQMLWPTGVLFQPLDMKDQYKIVAAVHFDGPTIPSRVVLNHKHDIVAVGCYAEERPGDITFLSVATKKLTGTVLKGHTLGVTTLCYSPDGKQLASGSWDKTVRLWDIATGKSVATLKGHTNKIRHVAYSIDGKSLASASIDGTVRLWDTASGNHIATFSGHDGAVYAAVFTPDGKRLVTGGTDGKIRVWDVTTRKKIDTFDGQVGLIYSIAISVNGVLAVAGDEKCVKLWRLDTHECTHTLKGHVDRIIFVVFNDDGTRLASCGFDDTLRIWDVISAQSVAILHCNCTVTSAAFVDDNLVIAASFSALQVWQHQFPKK